MPDFFFGGIVGWQQWKQLLRYVFLATTLCNETTSSAVSSSAYFMLYWRLGGRLGPIKEKGFPGFAN